MLAMQNELKLDPQHTCKKLSGIHYSPWETETEDSTGLTCQLSCGIRELQTQ